jgi:hypothetical protein
MMLFVAHEMTRRPPTGNKGPLSLSLPDRGKDSNKIYPMSRRHGTLDLALFLFLLLYPNHNSLDCCAYSMSVMVNTSVWTGAVGSSGATSFGGSLIILYLVNTLRMVKDLN